MTQSPDTPRGLEELAGRLTEAQRAMLLREPGRYQDGAADILALMDAEVWGTFITPLGLALRSHIQGNG